MLLRIVLPYAGMDYLLTTAPIRNMHLSILP